MSGLMEKGGDKLLLLKKIFVTSAILTNLTIMGLTSNQLTLRRPLLQLMQLLQVECPKTTLVQFPLSSQIFFMAILLRCSSSSQQSWGVMARVVMAGMLCTIISWSMKLQKSLLKPAARAPAACLRLLYQAG